MWGVGWRRFLRRFDELELVTYMAAEHLRLLIVIVTYNSRGDIEKCIRSIDRFGACFTANGSLRVCVIDNASTDGTRKVLEGLATEFSWLDIKLLEKNLGFGCANNVALKEYVADVFFLLNADAWLIGDCLSPVVNRIQNDRSVGVVGIPLRFPDGRPQTHAYSFSSWQRWTLYLIGVRSIVLRLIDSPMIARLLGELPLGRTFVATHSAPPIDFADKNALANEETLEVQSVDWVCGAAMALSRKFVMESGGFDPRIFLYGEDEDLCIDAHKRGFKVETLKTVPVVHVLGWGKKTFRPKVAKMKYDSLSYFIKKNVPSVIDRLMMRALLPFYVYGWRALLLAHIRGSGGKEA